MQKRSINYINFNKHFFLVFIASIIITYVGPVLSLFTGMAAISWFLGIIIFDIVLLKSRKPLYIFILVSIYFSSFLGYSASWSSVIFISGFNPLLLFPFFSVMLIIFFWPFKKLTKLYSLEKLTLFYYLLFLVPFLYGKGETSMFIFFTIYISYFLFLIVSIRNKNYSIEKLLTFYMYSISIVNVISLILQYEGFDIIYSEYFGLSQARMFALWGALNSNRFAALLGIGLIINLHLYFKYKKSFLLVNMVLFSLSLFYILSRTALIVDFFIVMLYFFMVRKIKPTTIILFSIIFILLYITSNQVYMFLERGDSAAFSTLSFRTIIWGDIIKQLSENIYQSFIGFGVSNNPILRNVSVPVSHAHSGYLELIVETGFFGLIVYMTINILALKKLFKYRKLNSWYSIIFLMILQLMLSSITEPLTVGVYYSAMLIHQLLIVITANFTSNQNHVTSTVNNAI